MHSRRQIKGLICGLTAAAYLAAISAAQSSNVSFEVSLVKVDNALETKPSSINASTPGRFTATNTPVRFLVLYAYGLLDHQLAGMPDWTSSSSFDVTATYASDSKMTERDLRMMVRDLLQDRFGLRVHEETRQLPSFSLVVARKDGRLGPALARSEVDCEKWIAEKRPQAQTGGPSTVTPTGKRSACEMMATRRWLAGGTRTMAQLAAALQSMVGRPVVDRTGLAGGFDMDLKWATNETTEDGDGGPSIFTALQEQLGLKLESERNPFQVVVVDRITRPTAN